MSFALYTIGYLIVIAGVAYVMHLAHIPQAWMIGVIIIMLGAGIVTGVKNTRAKDPS